MANLVWKLWHTVWTIVITPLQIKTYFSQFFSVFAVKDVDTKEKIADLETKIVELEKQNAGLKNKVSKWLYWLIKYSDIVNILLLIAVIKVPMK